MSTPIAGSGGRPSGAATAKAELEGAATIAGGVIIAGARANTVNLLSKSRRSNPPPLQDGH